MNEQLQNALSEIINKTLDGVDASVGFLQAELPDYIYQLLLWYGVKNAIVATVYLVMSVVIVFSCKSIYQKLLKPWYLRENKKEYSGDTFAPCGFGVLMVVIALMVVIPLFLSSLRDYLEALQIWIAPKVWLLEYASSLVK